MSQTLTCVGGPWHGKTMTVNGNSLLAPVSLDAVELVPAWHLHSDGPHHPSSVAPKTKCGVYRRETVMFDSGNGLQVSLSVLAYYGSEPADRPRNFHL